MIVAIYCFFVAYAVTVIILTVGILRLRHEQEPNPSGRPPAISVLVAVRNEADHILSLIEDLRQQSSPFEAIFIDDHSTDETPKLILSAINSLPNARLISLEDGAGKKSAITQGMLSATGDLIMTTDGDCRVGRNWLSAMSIAFTDPRIQMVLGPVSIAPAGGWSAVQALEFATVMGTTAGLVAFQKPIMCNGANLAYRRKTFDEVGGYSGNEYLPTGDDEFLLRKITRAFPGGVKLTLAKDAQVTTGALPLAKFLSQRVRWASKWNRHKDRTSAAMAVFVFALHLLTMAILYLWLAGKIPVIVGGTLLVMKVVPEVIFTMKASRAFRVKCRVWTLVLLELVYSPYVFLIGLLANFGAYRWKERRFAVRATRVESVT